MKCVLLIDDDEPTNFLHKIVLEDTGVTKNIAVAETVKEALHLLDCHAVDDCKKPDLIFLDLNMPGLTGWDFIDSYREARAKCRKQSKIVILTTSSNPDDMERAGKLKEVAEFRSKPLTNEMVEEIMHQYF